MLDVESVLQWSHWVPLDGSGKAGTSVPEAPGLYRIWRVGREDLDYIGQTGMGGMTLRKRLRMLRGVYAEDMPYRDPHTAAPALWALRHASGCDFVVSVVPVVGETPWRKGLEALAIGLYRQEHGRSPTVEFGRVPIGYRPSSGNNRQLQARGSVFRGGVCEVEVGAHIPGITPLGPLSGNPQGDTWGGHVWSPWMPLTQLSRSVAIGIGIYRIRGEDRDALLYVGQGRIPYRPIQHYRKARVPGHPQGGIFAAQQRLEVSWVLSGEWLAHQRLELENDLIAAHLLVRERIPAAQFLG